MKVLNRADWEITIKGFLICYFFWYPDTRIFPFKNRYFSIVLPWFNTYICYRNQSEII